MGSCPTTPSNSTKSPTSSDVGAVERNLGRAAGDVSGDAGVELLRIAAEQQQRRDPAAGIRGSRERRTQYGLRLSGAAQDDPVAIDEQRVVEVVGGVAEENDAATGIVGVGHRLLRPFEIGPLVVVDGEHRSDVVVAANGNADRVRPGPRSGVGDGADLVPVESGLHTRFTERQVVPHLLVDLGFPDDPAVAGDLVPGGQRILVGMTGEVDVAPAHRHVGRGLVDRPLHGHDGQRRRHVGDVVIVGGDRSAVGSVTLRCNRWFTVTNGGPGNRVPG